MKGKQRTAMTYGSVMATVKEMLSRNDKVSVLAEAESLINGDRAKSYGHPYFDFKRTTGMLNALFEHKLREPFVPSDFALIMECCKMSREVNCHKRDNAVDGAGYWGTLEKVYEKQEELKNAK